MKITRAFIFTAVAAAAFSTAAAGGPVPLARSTPVKETVKPVLVSTAAVTVQLRAAEGDCTDFDALSAVDDPLYREGSKEMLKQVCENDAAAIAAAAKAAPVMRDAPNSKPAPKLKKPRVKKPAPVDPVKAKSSL